MFNETLEEKIRNNTKKLKELSLYLEKVNQTFQIILNELGVNEEQLKAHMSQPDQFSQEIWAELQKEKQIHDEKLQIELDRISNPHDTAKARKQQSDIQQHWLFVR